MTRRLALLVVGVALLAAGAVRADSGEEFGPPGGDDFHRLKPDMAVTGACLSAFGRSRPARYLRSYVIQLHIRNLTNTPAGFVQVVIHDKTASRKSTRSVDGGANAVERLNMPGELGHEYFVVVDPDNRTGDPNRSNNITSFRCRR